MSIKKDSNKIHNKYKKFLKNKRVIIVGPSYHTKNFNKSKFVESYDVVVRVNLGFRIKSKKVENDIGMKMNIWYCSFGRYFFRNEIFNSCVLKNLKEINDLKWISFIYSGRRASGFRLLKNINEKQNLPIHFVDSYYYYYLYSKIGNKISSGMMSIYDLLQFDIKELYVMGFSFYNIDFIGKRRSYYSQYQEDRIYTDPKKGGKHNFLKELSFFYSLYKSDNRIRCDEVLEKIINKHGESN